MKLAENFRDVFSKYVGPWIVTLVDAMSEAVKALFLLLHSLDKLLDVRASLLQTLKLLHDGDIRSSVEWTPKRANARRTRSKEIGSDDPTIRTVAVEQFCS